MSLLSKKIQLFRTRGLTCKRLNARAPFHVVLGSLAMVAISLTSTNVAADEAAAAKFFGQVCLQTAPTFAGAETAVRQAGGTQAHSGQWSKGNLYASPGVALSASGGKACVVSSLRAKPKTTASALQQILPQYGARQISGERRGVRTVFKFEKTGREMTLKIEPFSPGGTTISILESRFNVRDFK